MAAATMLEAPVENVSEEARNAFQIFITLTQESKDAAVEYLRFLAKKDAARRAERMEQGAEEIRNLIGDDIPWTSEDEMQAELLADRRARRSAKRVEKNDHEVSD